MGVGTRAGDVSKDEADRTAGVGPVAHPVDRCDGCCGAMGGGGAGGCEEPERDEVAKPGSGGRLGTYHVNWTAGAGRSQSASRWVRELGRVCRSWLASVYERSGHWTWRRTGAGAACRGGCSDLIRY